MQSEQLTLFTETAQKLSLARDLDSIMDIVRKAARQLTGADGASFVLRDGDLCYYAQEDAISPLWKGQRFPMSSCISGWTMLNKKAAIISDIYSDARIPIDAYRPTFVKSLVMVPIRKLEPIGAIGNYWAKQHDPTLEEVQLLQSLADLTSVSMQNVYIINDLEERIKARTMELEQTNQELEAFTGSVSHDLRGPLGSIHSLVRLLMEGYEEKLDGQGREIISYISQSSEKLMNLVDELLLFSKLGTKEVERSQLNMSQLLDKVLLEHRKSKPHSAVIRVGDLHEIEADYTLIYQVFLNLVSNAVKYSSKKEKPLIEISSEDIKGTIVYSVKDNGAGFDMKQASKLFGAFERLHHQSEFDGNGIGLNLVHRIITKHGGKIWAEAKVNKGAVFSFYLKKKQLGTLIAMDAIN